MLVPLLIFTLFTSAFLLFWCQPMVAKMMLPLLGGSASTWTTCVLFFQTMLLCGYAYAYLLSKKIPQRIQFPVHIALMVCAIPFLPIRLAADTGGAMGQPVTWLLVQLLTTTAIPFLVVSTTAPLLQQWLAG